jgi:Uma2 family endonuclease
MPAKLPRMLLEVRYYQAAQEYLRNLPLEHFMEATPQARQREITLASFALVRPHRPAFHYYNEFLVQYPLPRQKRPGQVVPDNLVVIHDGELKVEGSYDVPLQPARPFWALEYVSKSNKRKDYDDNMRKYEHELKVPYYLLFQPDVAEMSLYRHTGKKYVSVKPNARERCAIEELELDVALHGDWVRYWFRGELLPLPDELQQQRDQALARAEQAESEIARLRKELEQLKRKPRRNGG